MAITKANNAEKLFDGASNFTSTSSTIDATWESLCHRTSTSTDEQETMSSPDSDEVGEKTDKDWSAKVIAAVVTGRKNISPEELKKIKEDVEAALKKRQAMTHEALAAFGIQPTPEALAATMNELEQPGKRPRLAVGSWVEIPEEKMHFFSKIATYPELIIEMAAHMRVADLISMFAISRDFHDVIKGHMAHTMKLCAKTQAVESYHAFHPEMYIGTCIPDPVGRAVGKGKMVRLVPGLQWLQMIFHREKVVRDILALMARQGHRMPKDMSFSLKKMWLLMDIGTNANRKKLIGTTFFKAKDLYNMQMFFIKLDMRFNDPIDGPGYEGLKNLMLGQRSLTTLCNLLKKKINTMEVMKMDIRYEFSANLQHLGQALWNISPTEFGVGHLEGWGRGTVHLLRPDELVIKESVRRQLGMHHHLTHMLLWGYVDKFTGLNTPPTADEMYMSDDDESRSDLERMMEAMKMSGQS